jgi:para-nitrobenzyl esterase
LLLSPQAHGLFHRAVVESGGLRLSDTVTAENFTDDTEAGSGNSSNEVLLRLLMRDHLASDRGAAKLRLATMSRSDIEGYLRGKSNFEILTAYTPMPGMGMIRMPQVFRDGTVLPQGDPMEQLARSDGYNRVPVMLGTNRDENKLFMFGDRVYVHKLLWIAPRLRDERAYNLAAEYLAKMWKASGADEPAAAMRNTQPGVFVYRFDWDEEPRILGADLSVMLGAAHGFEIPFVFGHFDLGRAGNMIFTTDNEPGRTALAAQMMSYWAEFAYNGAPGRGRNGTLPAWEAWDGSRAEAPKFIVLDTVAGGGVRMSPTALTQAGVLASVESDPRLPTQRDKCIIYHELAQWPSPRFTRKEYAAAGKAGCAAYPFDRYPWTG